ncbi:DUF4279 domain-containing protein [Rheinheimera sp. FR7-31]|uniref:DUF4279 domain-containing protein n=1 Tax=Rheinheimera fenheensis TaxID=3152295 RepID=UPI00325D8A16
MAILSKTKMSLRIIGDDLVPDEVSLLLVCRPTREMIKGKPFSWKKDGNQRLAKSGMWRLEANDQIPGDLDAQVFELLDQLTDNLDTWAVLSEKYKLDMFCGLFMESGMEGISLSAKSLLALGQRGIEIGFDMYGPDDESV